MIDLKKMKPEEIAQVCKARGVKIDVPQLLAVLDEKTTLLAKLEDARSRANDIAKLVQTAPAGERAELIREGGALKHRIKIYEGFHTQLNTTFEEFSLALPNDLAKDTPIGTSDAANVQVEVFGEPRKFEFRPKDHLELGKDFGMDLEAGTRVAGSGFPLMRGPLAQMESAMLRFVYDKAISSGFTPVSVPVLAKTAVLKGIGFNPRRADDGTEIFFTNDDLCLAGTAEIPLVGQYAGQIIETKELPIKLVALTPCFRREGAHGRRDAGLYRNRMFYKVELVVLAEEGKTDAIHEEIRAFETEVFKELGLHFRVLRISSGDLGAPAFKKYDLEGWMMGRGGDSADAGWGELTSCSNCTDFQSRRLMIRHKSGDKKPEYVHTLNGTGVTTRALICLLEQHQNADGSVNIPPVLRQHMAGKEILRKE